MIDIFSERTGSLREFAAEIGVCEMTLIRAAERGDLERVRVGGKWRTSAEAIQRWVERTTARHSRRAAEPVLTMDQMAPRRQP